MSEVIFSVFRARVYRKSLESWLLKLEKYR